ncbi:MAG: nucleotidyl transferase AbiEii/AbiGii toxin family protein [Spirochaetales bacterium]|nr:nucleotidyl transferase AbiEii/AbiGii toxin family protein [Spirochaetales bacterium]
MLDLHTEFAALIRSLGSNSIDYALCGGLALAVHAQPRATVDIDLLAPDSAVEAIEKVLYRLGYTIASDPMEFGGGATRIRRWSKPYSDGDVLSVDVLLVTAANVAAWNSVLTLTWNGEPLRVVSREGLIHLKRMRGSPQDLADIENLRKTE